MDHQKDSTKNIRPTTIGGQAVIEGVMMKGPYDIAIAVRKPDQEIVIKKEAIKGIAKSKMAKLPIVRGMIALFDAMVLGVKSLTYSAEFFEEDEEIEKGKLEIWMEKVFGEKANDLLIYLSVLVAMTLAVLIFIISPTIATNFLKEKMNHPFFLNLFEGILRMVLFILYILLISRMKDIQRVFEYHGAEHKTIHCYEHGLPLTVENAKKFKTLHPRCGTNFLLIVMIISMILFSTMGWPNPFIRIVSRFILMPIVAGLSYEVIRWAGKSSSKWVSIVSYPGLMLQKLTTREPDDRQLEVAILAMENVLVENQEDLWQ